jgi:hypothetical protein
MVHWWRRRWRLRAAGRGCLHFFRWRVTGARGYGRVFGRWHLPPRQRLRLAGGLRSGQLRGGGACVQRQARRDEESSRRDGCVPASVLPLGFVAWGGGATEAEGGME